MNTQDVEAFLAIIEKENFTDAAKSLYISQSTLSHRLTNLEKELGSTLIERSKGCKKIYLTDVGKEFLVSAKKWQMFATDVERIKYAWKKRYRISIGSVDTFNAFIFPKLYNTLLDREPSLILNIRTFNSDELYQQMDMGRLDIAFTLLNLPYRNIKAEEFYREPRVILKREDPKVGKKKRVGTDTLDIRDLDKSKEIFFIGDPAYNKWYRQTHDNDYPNVQADTVQLLRVLMPREGSWSIVPLCVGKAFGERKEYNYYKMINSSPERICYKIESTQKKPGTAKMLSIVEKHLQEFKKNLADI